MQELIKSQRDRARAKLNYSGIARLPDYFNAFPHAVLSPSR